MIDKLITAAADFLQSKMKTTTLLKVTLLTVILSLPMGWVLGEWVTNLALVSGVSVPIILEFLYAKVAENEVSEESDSENASG